MLTLLEHEAEVSSVVWSPDGKRLVCGSSDSTVKIWDASLGYELESSSDVKDVRLNLR